MTRDELERLAWERIDGEISTEDQARLDRMLEEDEPARERLAALQRLADRLAGIEPAAPPAELRARIDRALAATSPRWRRQPSPARRWDVRLAYLAAGVMLGLVAARLLLPAPEVSRRDVTGAMVAPAAAVTVDLDRAGALAIWRTEPALAVVELDLATAADVEVVLEAETGTLTLVRAELAGARRGEAVTEDGRVRVAAQGPGRCAVTVASDGVAAISIRATSAGRLLAERLVQPEQLGGDP